MRFIACIIIVLAFMIALAEADGNFKKITGVNLGGLGGTTQTQKMKTIVGINFEGLQGGSQNQSGNFKTLLGTNFEGLQVNSQEEILDPGPFEAINVSESTMMVYVGQSSIPLNMYQTTFGNYLWIEGTQAWSQYASIPQYSSIPLVAYTPTGGQGEILEMYPRGSTQGVYKGIYYDFNPGYNRLMYRGDVAGKHYLLFAVNDQPSNSIIIDVTGGSVLGSAPVLGTAPSSAMP
jgi:hypothetical protein